MTQTAVEWYKKEVVELAVQLQHQKIDLYEFLVEIQKREEQAKEMEKQQIMDARLDGFMISGEGYNAEYPFERYTFAHISEQIGNEQYYNNTFKKMVSYNDLDEIKEIYLNWSLSKDCGGYGGDIKADTIEFANKVFVEGWENNKDPFTGTPLIELECFNQKIKK